MKARIAAATLIVAVVSVWSLFGFGRSDAGDTSPVPKTAEDGKVQEQDFGDRVLMLYMRGENGNGANGVNPTPVMEKAKVRRLGDRTYLVGRMPDLGDAGKGFNGTTIWIATSEILQITEHESLKALQEYVEAVGKARGK